MTDLTVSMVMPPIPALTEFPNQPVPLPLSQALRAGTELAHKSVELRLGLPGTIRSLPDYRACLLGFYQIYGPIEIRFQGFSEWTSVSLDPPSRSLSTRLAADLQALAVSVAEIASAPASSLPPVRDFAGALGACYVMEGSALGSQFMLPDLQKTLGGGMTGADSFFRGRGAETGSYWKRFRAALDLYGDTYPDCISQVVASAIATFEAIGLWIQPAMSEKIQP